MRWTREIFICFLIGVGIHSVYLRAFPVFGYAVIGAGALVFLAVSESTAHRRGALLGVLALCLGIWRFEMMMTPKCMSVQMLRLPYCKTASVITSLPGWNGVSMRLESWQEKISGRIRELFPGDEAELLIGMLYGGQTFSKIEKASFQRAGLTHLVAVSGSNVTIVVTVMFGCAMWLRLRRRMVFWCTSAALFGFVCFVGFSASVMRAAIMGWLCLLGRELGRIPSATHLLLVVAVILVWQEPRLLVFDASFGLSFLAMIGVLVWAPKLQDRLLWIPERFGLRENLSVTLAATLLTAPYIAWMFGSVSGAGIVTNLLALPLVPFVMLWGAMAALGGANVFALPARLMAHGLLSLILAIAHLADWFPWLLWSVPFSATAMGMAYVLIGMWWFGLERDEVIHKMRVAFLRMQKKEEDCQRAVTLRKIFFVMKKYIQHGSREEVLEKTDRFF